MKCAIRRLSWTFLEGALVHLNGSVGRGSSGVNLNAIPLSVIDHIEVLRDGAAARSEDR